MMTTGFVKVHRALFTSPFWREKRRYSHFEAIVYLLRSAYFGEKPQIFRVKGHDVRVTQGDYLASYSYMAQRWGWSIKAVRTFLRDLKREGLVREVCRLPITVINVGPCLTEEGPYPKAQRPAPAAPYAPPAAPAAAPAAAAPQTGWLPQSAYAGGYAPDVQQPSAYIIDPFKALTQPPAYDAGFSPDMPPQPAYAGDDPFASCYASWDSQPQSEPPSELDAICASVAAAWRGETTRVTGTARGTRKGSPNGTPGGAISGAAVTDGKGWEPNGSEFPF